MTDGSKGKYAVYGDGELTKCGISHLLAIDKRV